MIRLLAIIILTAGCGSLRAPAGTALSQQTAAVSSTSLEAVEGRPAGVVLRLQCSNPRATTLELYRVWGDQDPQLLQELRVDGRLAASLSTGLEIVDSTVVAPERFSYQLFAIVEEEVVERSEIVDVDWQEPPRRPTDATAVAVFADTVELSWNAPAALGAVIFRRDVLAEDSPFERVARVRAPASTWVDRDVRAAGVWSYRVALVRESAAGFVQFGAPSEEVYASTPETR